MVQALLANKIDGIAISPIDPDNQPNCWTKLAADDSTHDSDAPNSQRVCYAIGMDNYIAGRMCGQLVKEALPDGGSLMMFVGRLGQANARLRQKGIDEVLDSCVGYDGRCHIRGRSGIELLEKCRCHLNDCPPACQSYQQTLSRRARARRGRFTGLPRRSVWRLVGENGAGKSSLMKILSGIEQAQRRRDTAGRPTSEN